MSETNFITFKTICDFVKELSNLYGSKQYSLKLYERLISLTTISHHNSVQKHIESFKRFCVQNIEAIKTQDCSKITQSKIT